jgi:cytochrome P450
VKQDEEISKLDAGAIQDLLAMLLGAGSDTTSAALQIFFKVMANHPQELKTAQEGNILTIQSTSQY